MKKFIISLIFLAGCASLERPQADPPPIDEPDAGIVELPDSPPPPPPPDAPPKCEPECKCDDDCPDEQVCRDGTCHLTCDCDYDCGQHRECRSHVCYNPHG